MARAMTAAAWAAILHRVVDEEGVDGGGSAPAVTEQLSDSGEAANICDALPSIEECRQSRTRASSSPANLRRLLPAGPKVSHRAGALRAGEDELLGVWQADHLQLAPHTEEEGAGIGGPEPEAEPGQGVVAEVQRPSAVPGSVEPAAERVLVDIGLDSHGAVSCQFPWVPPCSEETAAAVRGKGMQPVRRGRWQAGTAL